MTQYSFTVDAELLRELGARLVGRPHIALAELIKNSYDADATHVELKFLDGEITVSDNGHGMSENAFIKRWMRLGTTQKRIDRFSPRFARPLTGSKGVGRLAVQLLAERTTLISVGLVQQDRPKKSALHAGIVATVNWQSVKTGSDLAAVKVDVNGLQRATHFPNGSKFGTTVKLSGLAEEWTADQFRSVAQEIWALRAPHREVAGKGMSVSLESDQELVSSAFADQMDAILDIWSARLRGKLLPIGFKPERVVGQLPSRLAVARSDAGAAIGPANKSTFLGPTRYLQIDIDMANGTSAQAVYGVENCPVDEVDYEIRVFDLFRRQPKGIRVGEARDYLRQFGGVGIYDTGFRLPYYGADQDWLDNERDYARRLARSDLVPEALQVSKGLQDLPGNSRVYGWVHVSTGHEEQVRFDRKATLRDSLSIQVSRDRLVDNAAYQQLRVLVRASLDQYAMEAAKAKLIASTQDSPQASQMANEARTSLAQQIEYVRDQLRPSDYEDLRNTAKKAELAAHKSEQQAQTYAALLGALATAGSTSLAYEHEISKQVGAVRDIVSDLASIPVPALGSHGPIVQAAAQRLENWLGRVKGIRAVFGPLLSQESRQRVETYNAHRTVTKVVRDISPLARGISVDTSGIPRDLLLPQATLPAWSAIFQNLLINAYNAMQSTPRPEIRVVGRVLNGTSSISVLDNGVGVDLDDAENLWRPFERRLMLPPEQEAAGLGGMGLGLTIVKMISDQLDVKVAFKAPPQPMRTEVRLTWREQQ